MTFKVQVPKNSDKADWNLAGQVLSMTLPLTDNVSVIKAKLHEALGMPAGKQKLQLEVSRVIDLRIKGYPLVVSTLCRKSGYYFTFDLCILIQLEIFDREALVHFDYF